MRVVSLFWLLRGFKVGEPQTSNKKETENKISIMTLMSFKNWNKNLKTKIPNFIAGKW